MIGLTGGTGYLGNVIARTLLERKMSCKMLVRSPEKVAEIGLPQELAVVGNILESDTLRAAFSGCDAVIHAAAKISLHNADEPELMRINVDGTQAVIDACRQCGVRRLVYIGSVEALDLEGGKGPGDDGRVDPDNPILAYGRTKALAVNRVLDAGCSSLSTVVLSPTAIIGPWDFGPSQIGRFVTTFLRRRLPAYVHGGFDFVDVRDIAGACVRATESGTSGRHYVLNGTYLEVRRMLEILEKISDVRMPGFCVPESVALAFATVNVALSRLWGRAPIITPQAVRLLSLRVACDRRAAENDLDYSVRDIRATLEDTVSWFRRTL